jgi:hypothetical protein
MTFVTQQNEERDFCTTEIKCLSKSVNCGLRTELAHFINILLLALYLDPRTVDLLTRNGMNILRKYFLWWRN